jgi:basic amino acid/polyamine antiporter, APA family
MSSPTTRPLRRILGLGFGLALAVGASIGVGILRLPGLVAARLGDRDLIIVFWTIGGVYALLGAVAVAELAAMIPETGGFRVYARRAFGEGAGFVIGWCDWLVNVSAIAYASVTAVTFLTLLWPAVANVNPHLLAVVFVGGFTAVHWSGLRLGSTLTAIISAAIALMLLVLVASCFLMVPDVGAAAAPLPNTAATLPWLSVSMAFAVVPALRAILTAFDGWYSPIYMAEENTAAVRNLPRAIIGGAALLAVLYLLVNLALVRVLPVSALAASPLAAADAAQVVFHHGGVTFVTVISLCFMLSLLNNLTLLTPRILFAIGRDGLFTQRAAIVSQSGTPRTALAFTSVAAVLVIVSGSFEQIVALYTVLFLICYLSAFLAVFVLRAREPLLPRPFRAIGYPLSTGIVLLGSLAFLIAAVIEDPRSGLIAAAFVSACVPFYAWFARRRRLATALSVA